MHKAWALILALALVLGLLGCTGRKMAPDGGSAGETPETAEPQPRADRQEIALNLAADPGALDPHLATDHAALTVLKNAMEGLVRPDPSGRIAPGSGQAASWTISDDGLAYTFTLKDGLTWSDGRPVTADDFAFAWRRALDPRTASPYAYQFFPIKGAAALHRLRPEAPDFAERYEQLASQLGIQAEDEQTLKVTLAAPAPQFLGLTALPAFFPLRREVVEAQGSQFGAAPDGLVWNGPFQVTGWTHGSELVLGRNPQYWDASHVRLERAVFHVIGDANTAIRRYESGQLDQLTISGEMLASHQNRAPERAVLAATYYITLNTRHPVLKHPRVRRALGLALDRSQFVEQTARNGAVVANGLVPPSVPYVAPVSAGGAPQAATACAIAGPIGPHANPAEARDLLAQGLAELEQSGAPPLKLLIEDNPTAHRYARALQEMWQENLGLAVALEPVTPTVRLERARANDFEMMLSGWIGDYLSPMAFLSAWVSDSPFNDARWSDAQYDRLIAQARHAPAGADCAGALMEAEGILLQEMPLIPLYHPVLHWYQQDWLHGVERFPLGGEPDLRGAYVEGRPPG